MTLSLEQWAEIERAWSEGLESVRSIADRYGIGEAAIRGRAKRSKWPDRAPQPKQARRQAQNRVERMPVIIPSDPAAAVERIATTAAGILTTHRNDLAALRMLVTDTADELRWQFENRQFVEDRLRDYFTAKAALNPLQADAYLKQLNMALSSLGTGGRSKTIQNLVASYEKLTEMERKNWKLDEESDSKSYEQYLREIHGKAMPNDEGKTVEMLEGKAA